MNADTVVDALRGQSPQLIAAVTRLVERIVERRRVVDEAELHREIEATFADVNARFAAAHARLVERFPEQATEQATEGEP